VRRRTFAVCVICATFCDGVQSPVIRTRRVLQTPMLLPLSRRTSLANNFPHSDARIARSSGARAGEKWRTLRTMIKQLSCVIVACTAVVLGGCESVRTTSAGTVGVDRKQQMLVPSETIEQGAAQAYEAELKTARIDVTVEFEGSRVLGKAQALVACA